MWVWAAAVAGLLLIGFIVFATLNNNSNTASGGSSPPTTAEPHRDTAEHHRLRLVIAAADHPGAIEERHTVTRGPTVSASPRSRLRTRPPKPQRNRHTEAVGTTQTDG